MEVIIKSFDSLRLYFIYIREISITQILLSILYNVFMQQSIAGNSIALLQLV